MPQPSFHKIEAVEKQVAEILRRDWKPVDGIPDETYAYYAAQLTKMRVDDADVRAMQLYIEWEEGQLGLDLFDTQRALRVIEAIKAIRI